MRIRHSRRRFLQLGAAALGPMAMASACLDMGKRMSGLGWQVGIGEDPGRFIWEIESDPQVAAVAQAWDPHFLSGWLNSFDHKRGDLSFWRDWHQAGWLADWFERGYSLHIITWEDDTTRPCGEYHLSEQFLEDVGELAGYMAQANPQGRRTDWSLATEFSYWRVPADTYNSETAPYYQALMQNLLKARQLIKERLPEAQVALCWGGWIATFDQPERGSGRSMVDPFAEMMSQMDGIAFQSMRQRRTGEFNPELNAPDPGNPEQIRLCCQLFSPIHSNLMLAHYEPAIKDKHPSGGRADTVQEDFQIMSQPDWLAEVSRLGLRRMSLMHYGLYKGDPFGALTAARQFRTRVS
ncbi:MAG: hypothetical protein Q6K85_10605 [Thermostichus sp. DG02_1_bins_55]